MQRPNKLHASRVGDVISQSFYYDGRTLTLFNPDDGVYATVAAPGTLDAMIDFARDSLDVIAPAGDLITMDAYDAVDGGYELGLRGRQVVHRRRALRPSRVPRIRRRLADLDRGRSATVAPQVRHHDPRARRRPAVRNLDAQLDAHARRQRGAVRVHASAGRATDRIPPGRQCRSAADDDHEQGWRHMPHRSL